MNKGNLKQILYPVCQFCHHRLNEFGGCDNCNCVYYTAGQPEAYEIKKQLERYEKLDAEAEEIAREDRIYRKKIVK